MNIKKNLSRGKPTIDISIVNDNLDYNIKQEFSIF